MQTARSVASAAVVPAGFLMLALQQHQAGRPFRASAAVALALASVIIALLVMVPRLRRLVPALAPLGAAVLVGIFVTERLAVVPAALSVLFLVLVAFGVDIGGPIERATAAFGRAATVVAGSVLFAVIVLPGWAWSRVRRRDPLDASGGWHRVGPDPGQPTRLGRPPSRPVAQTGLIGRIAWAIGTVTLLLAGNYGIGWAWDRAVSKDLVPTPLVEATDLTTVNRDPRNDVAAMANYPWRKRYFEDIQRTRGGYWPFTEYRPADFSSPYVNQRGWIRSSYEPPGDQDSMPSVWMFGGSTTWGEGQRDDYTIASWLSRLAEEDGVPIHIANYGERGWTHFQEMILFEQQLASEKTPDLAVFYDGANEVTTQSLLTEAVPSHTLAFTYAQRLGGVTIATQFAQKPQQNLVDDLWHAYSQHSAAHKVVAWLRGTPAGASPAQEPNPSTPGEGFQGGQIQRDDGGVYEYQMTPQDGTDAGRVYERGKQLTLSIAARYGVDVALFWQPMGFMGEWYQNARAELTDPTVDISEVLQDHDEGAQNVFIDGGHTNEEGARLVAVAIWAEIRPRIERWYAQQ